MASFVRTKTKKKNTQEYSSEPLHQRVKRNGSGPYCVGRSTRANCSKFVVSGYKRTTTGCLTRYKTKLALRARLCQWTQQVFVSQIVGDVFLCRPEDLPR